MTPRLGLLLLGRHPVGEFAEMVREAESVGYDALWYADERFFRDCWAGLSYAAAQTTEIQLGVCVTDPFVRHPALTAAAIATVDELSGGRATLGLGAGVSGFAEMGIRRDRPLTAMREAIGLIRGLLRGERITMEGGVIEFHDGALDFPTRADLPIMVATNGPRMLQLAGELADAVMVQNLASETMAGNVLALVAEGAERGGRTPGSTRLIARLDVCISDTDPAAAKDRVRPGIARHLATHHPRYASFELAGIDVPDEVREVVAEVGYTHGGNDALVEVIPDEWVDRLCLAGTTDEVAERVTRLLSAGVDDITIMPLALEGTDPRETMRRMATDVMPLAMRGVT